MEVDMIPPYPLLWPDNQPRTSARGRSAFTTKFDGALKNVQTSLRLFASDSGKSITEVQITSNASWVDQRPADPGIAVWFTWDGAQRCIAVDRYATVAENLQALHHVLEARRTELRHAGINMVRTTFRGFTAALPAPGQAHWTTILGVPPGSTRDQVQAAYRDKARELGATGNDAARAELNVARDKAMKELT
jgi:hypothetical protein